MALLYLIIEMALLGIIQQWHYAVDQVIHPARVEWVLHSKRPANYTVVACLILLKVPSSGGAALGARWPCDH